MSWGTPVERETKLRILLSAAAYAYEINNDPICSDAEFDSASRLVNLDIKTTRPDLDAFFKEHFDPSTGIWIHQHPELAKVKALADKLRQR